MKIERVVFILISLVLYSGISVKCQETAGQPGSNSLTGAESAENSESHIQDTAQNYDATYENSAADGNQESDPSRIEVRLHNDGTQVPASSDQTNNPETPSINSASGSNDQALSTDEKRPNEASTEIDANEEEKMLIYITEPEGDDESQDQSKNFSDTPEQPQPIEDINAKVETSQTDNLKNSESQNIYQSNQQSIQTENNTASAATDVHRENQNLEKIDNESQHSQQQPRNSSQNDNQTSQADASFESEQEETQNIIQNNQNNSESTSSDSNNISEKQSPDRATSIDSKTSHSNESMSNAASSSNGNEVTDTKTSVADQAKSNSNDSHTPERTTEESKVQLKTSPLDSNENNISQSASFEAKHNQSQNTEAQRSIHSVQQAQQEPDQLPLDGLDELEEVNNLKEVQLPHSTDSQENNRNAEDQSKIQNTHINYDHKPQPSKRPEGTESKNSEQSDQKHGNFTQDSFIIKTNAWFSADFRNSIKSFYKYQEKFFITFIIPLYYQVKSSSLLTAILFFLIIMYVTKTVKGSFSLLFGGSSKIENKGKPMLMKDILQQLNAFSKEMEAIKASLPISRRKSKQNLASLDPQKISNVSQRLTQNEENLAKLFKENKQLNSYLGTFQREIVESHKEILNELHTLRTATRTLKAEPSSAKTDDRGSRATNAP